MHLNFITANTHPKLSEYLNNDLQVDAGAQFSHPVFIQEPDNKTLLKMASCLKTKEGAKRLQQAIQKGFGSRPFIVSQESIAEQIQKFANDIQEFVSLGGFFNLSIGKARFPVSYRIDRTHYFRISFVYDPEVEDIEVSLVDCLTSLERESLSVNQSVKRLVAA